MAKFYGVIGYAETVETAPGVWDEVYSERNHSGDVIRNSQRWQQTDKVNDDLTINNTISIIDDSFASQHINSMRYIKWMGAYWKITNVDFQRPRLILTIGGIYNGDKASTPSIT